MFFDKQAGDLASIRWWLNSSNLQNVIQNGTFHKTICTNSGLQHINLQYPCFDFL